MSNSDSPMTFPVRISVRMDGFKLSEDAQRGQQEQIESLHLDQLEELSPELETALAEGQSIFRAAAVEAPCTDFFIACDQLFQDNGWQPSGWPTGATVSEVRDSDSQRMDEQAAQALGFEDSFGAAATLILALYCADQAQAESARECLAEVCPAQIQARLQSGQSAAYLVIPEGPPEVTVSLGEAVKSPPAPSFPSL